MQSRRSSPSPARPGGASWRRMALPVLALVGGALASPGPAMAQQTLLNAPCTAAADQQVTEPATGRTYLLDYPCDLRAGERITFILNLHGGGSSGTWQRRYFPAYDQKEAHRLVVASPYSPTRSWSTNDDEYLQNVVSQVVAAVGRENIESFWLAGHSQGGSTSRRLVCTPFFETKVDGFLSLSGGRLGGAASRAPTAGRPRQAGDPAPAPPAAPPAPPATPPAAPAEPTCEFSHIFAIGEHEIASLPTTSTLADRYGCGDRIQEDDVVDTEPGYVHDGGRQNPGTREWGLLPRPGRAEVFVYPDCAGGKVVADVVRIDKGHTEGLEPRVTERLVELMRSAEGGKLRR
jgi:pimeloyl-ACP methyl ester carboxylesterase